MMKGLYLFFLILFAGYELRAANFFVTINDDAGVGSLREAITLANANGTSTTDFIYFNLPGSTISDVTIPLKTELPILTSNIVIDGTSQPFAALDHPKIRVSLVRISSAYFSGLRLDNASGIAIYGLAFSNFKSDPLGAVDDKKGGIFLSNSSYIQIGERQKPNCFGNNYAGIISPYVIPRRDNEQIRISGNIFGLGENGLNQQPNEVGIDVSFLKNSVIGGDTFAEGNLISANTRSGISLGGATDNIKISNNVVGLDVSMAKMVPSPNANGIYINGESAIPLVANNYVCGQKKGIVMDYVNAGFVVSENKVGTSINGSENFGNELGIHINFCNKGLIGGNASSLGNKIAYNKTAVLIEISYPISLLANSFYCNAIAVTYKSIPQGQSVTQSYIADIGPAGASGIYLPNAIVELFYTDACPDCEGKTWLATLHTDQNGKWSYNQPISGPITSMGTNADGATSTFSKPMIDESGARRESVYCGQSNGTISGLKIYDASFFTWYDASGKIVGQDRDLIDVGVGTYTLKVGQAGLCSATSSTYTIDAKNAGFDDSEKKISNEYCGGYNGSITQIKVSNNFARHWYNTNGDDFGTNDDLLNAPEGNYFFRAGPNDCIISPVYTIANIVLTYQVKAYQEIRATCGKPNGGIDIVMFEGEEPSSFKWYDADDNLVGSERNLTDKPPGKYKLICAGIKGCIAPPQYFEISPAPVPVINYSSIQKTINCDGRTIAVSGVTIDGSTPPYHVAWMDEDGNQVSDQLEIKTAPIGKYQLIVTDGNNCLIKGELIDFTALPVKKLSIPKAISPNQDGANDYWQISGIENYPLAEISIYNRNGSRVFFDVGYQKPFDGRRNGKALPVGVYYYIIDLKSGCAQVTGSLTILR